MSEPVLPCMALRNDWCASNDDSLRGKRLSNPTCSSNLIAFCLLGTHFSWKRMTSIKYLAEGAGILITLSIPTVQQFSSFWHEPCVNCWNICILSRDVENNPWHISKGFSAGHQKVQIIPTVGISMDLNSNITYPPRENRGNAIGATNGVFLGFDLLLVCLRVYVRTKVIKTFGWDDIFMIVALVRSMLCDHTLLLSWLIYQITAFIAMSIEAAATHNGLGQHIVYLRPEQASLVAKWNRIGQMPWVISNMFIKLSISVFLYRIFATKSSSKRALYPIIILNIIGNLASFTTILSQCTPVSKLWNPSIPGKCWNPKKQLDIGIFQGCKFLSLARLHNWHWKQLSLHSVILLLRSYLSSFYGTYR